MPATPTVYEAAGGEPGLQALARAWHQRVMADPVVSHAFHVGPLPDHVERLAAYWVQALGGPPAYTERYATEAHVVRLHTGNGPHEEMDERAIACFEQALEDVGIAASEPVHATLLDYFAQVARRLDTPSVEVVPEDRPVPRWSWEGPVSR